MCLSVADNPVACPTDAGDASVNCACGTSIPLDGATGCDPDKCDNCTVSFSTAFENKNYNVTATVTPIEDGKSSNLEIKSKGSFNNVMRQIDINTEQLSTQQAIIIENACVNPETTWQGETIGISADISTTGTGDTITVVSAIIKKSSTVVDTPSLDFINGHWETSWSTYITGAYDVTLDVRDSKGNEEVTPTLSQCILTP